MVSSVFVGGREGNSPNGTSVLGIRGVWCREDLTIFSNFKLAVVKIDLGQASDDSPGAQVVGNPVLCRIAVAISDSLLDYAGNK